MQLWLPTRATIADFSSGQCALALVLCSLLAPLAITTQTTAVIFTSFRYVLFLFAILLLLKTFIADRLAFWKTLKICAIYSVLVGYAFTAKYFSGNELESAPGMISYTIFIFAIFGALCCLDSEGFEKTRAINILLIVFGLGVFFINLMFGGVVFTPLPKFVFQFYSDLKGSSVLYSQGLSQVFGISAISSAVLALQLRDRQVFPLFCLAVVFVVMSFFSGGRGESAFAGLLVLPMFMTSTIGRLTLVSILLIAGVTIWIFIDSIVDPVFVSRFQILAETGMGVRGELYQKVFDLMRAKPNCIILGCGYDYFQYILNLDYGFYPHNILFEAILVYGLPIFSIFLLGTTLGLCTFIKKSKSQSLVFVILYFYFILIGMKSGTLISSVGFWGGSCFFYYKGSQKFKKIVSDTVLGSEPF